MIADCLNYNLKFTRGVEDIGVLPTEKGDYDNELRSVNGPNYGRIYDADVVDSLVDKFGDGVSRQWRVPGEFGKRVTVDKDNTTLYASDRDMFVFLADEENRIEIQGRRAGPVSAHGSAKDRNCALASTMRLTMPNRSKVLRASRSIRVTVTTSPGASLPSIRLSSRRSARATVTFSR
jgi:hypothetical protein